MQKKTEVYWGKYIRNKKSVWTGEHTDSLIEKKTIIEKINNLKKKWTLVGNGCQLIQCEEFLNVNKTQIFHPNAKDIIPFALLKIRNKKLFSSKENSINYLYNKF